MGVGVEGGHLGRILLFPPFPPCKDPRTLVSVLSLGCYRKSSWKRFHFPPMTPQRGQPRRIGATPGWTVTTGLLMICPTQSLQTPQIHSVQAKAFFKSHGRPHDAQ